MKYQTITLLASSPLIVGFVPPAPKNLNRHVYLNGQRGSMKRTNPAARSSLQSYCMDPRQRSAVGVSASSMFASKFRSGALFAKPRARLEDDDGEAEDLDYDEDDEDEEEEEEDEDYEIGNEDDEDEEEDSDEITMEYDDEEYDDEYEEEEYYDDDDQEVSNEEEEDGEYEYEYEENAEGEEAALTDSVPDVWASYDAKFEEPPTPLLETDDSDPYYIQARESVLSEVAERKAIAESEKLLPRNVESVDDIKKMIDYFQNVMTDEEKKEAESDPDAIEVAKIIKENNMQITEKDLKDYIIKDENGNDILDPEAGKDEVPFSEMHGYDAFPSIDDIENGGDLVFPSNKAYNEKDLVEIDDMLEKYRVARAQLENQTFFGEDHTFAYLDIERDWPRLDNKTQQEILDVIDNSNTMACPNPDLWLLYDLKFNVTNLILAAFKHNQEAPILFTQWMPQLEVYERYADQREKEFQWTWDDVEQADMSELERYYKGIGYDSIPLKEPSETGIITLDESEIDEEEREMLALENWYDEVYNEESDNLLFDDEAFEPKHNVFDPNYGKSSSDTTTEQDKFLQEFEAFEREFADQPKEWRDQFATVDKFEIIDDPEGQEAFRGHLVIACAPLDEDLDLAEKITERFQQEFGKAVFVETRVLGHAKKEDNVYEIWLESYDIDLLHSKRQAFINSQVWTGPSEVDDAQLDNLVEKVRDLISDESKYSYRMSDFADVKI